MPSVTGLTAARMLVIEASSVVGGVVNGGGHLILTKHDGSTIDAGSVIGPQGIQGVQGVAGDLDRASNQTITGIKTITKGLAFDGDGVLVNDIPLAKMGIGYDTVQFNIVDRVGGKAVRFWDTVNSLNRFDINAIAGIGVRAIGTEHRFGTGAMGGAGSYARIGDEGDPNNVYFLADGTSASIGNIFRAKGGGIHSFEDLGGGARVQFDPNGVIFARGLDHYLGGYAFGAVGTSRLHVATSPTGVLLIGEGDGANRDLVFRKKGLGNFYFQNEGGVTEVTVNNGAVSAVSTDHYFGPYAFNAGVGVSRLHIQNAGNSVILLAEGDGANRDLLLRVKGTGNFWVQNSDLTAKLNSDANNNLFSTGHDAFFGINALGGTGTRIHLGSLADPNTAYVIAEGTGSNVSLVLRAKGTGLVQLQDSAGLPLLTLAGVTGHMIAAGPAPTLSSFGAGISGGAVSGHEICGTITLNTTGAAVGTILAHVTFAYAYGVAPVVLLGAGSQGAASGFILAFASNITATGFDMQISAGVTPVAGTAVFQYVVVGK